MTRTASSGKLVKWLRDGLDIAAIIAVIGGIFYLGRLHQRVEDSHERIDGLADEVKSLSLRLDSQTEALEVAKDRAMEEIAALTGRQDDPTVFIDGRLTAGYDMGVSSESGKTDWVESTDDAVCMRYPGNQGWGAVFLTVGEPTAPPRPSRDLSQYESLSLDLRGVNGGESVEVGLKDSTDPDDGSESKIRLQGLSQEWKSYNIPLSRFRTADLRRLYVVTEFVFGRAPQSVCFRKIEYLP